MSETNIDENSNHANLRDQQGESSDFSAPLGTLRSGRLVFASGTSQVSLKADRKLKDLYRARFKRYIPRVWFHDDTLTLQYQRYPFHDLPAQPRVPYAEIILNGSIQWEIEFHNGVSELKAELGGLRLQSLDILGGASRIELALAKPDGSAFIYVSGGIHNATIRRPAGVGMRIQISGSVSELAFDDQHLEMVGGETCLESPDFMSATSRYDICIAGGVSLLTIDHEK